jgi:hypothetical protein
MVEKGLVPNSINKINTNYVASKSNGTKVIINGQSITSIGPYFDPMFKIDAAIQRKLLSTLFQRLDSSDVVGVHNKVKNAILSKYRFKKPCSDRKWVECDSSISKTLKAFVATELNSTAFMIRALCMCVMVSDTIKSADMPPITFTFNGGAEHMTGNWDEDKENITMAYTTPNQTSRLIMGFGPSASGKTYWAQNVINLFAASNPTFPTTFFSIDGGLYRSASMIYSMIIDCIKKTCIAGFSNLVSSDDEKSIFRARTVKENVEGYLKLCKSKGLGISLYVPESLGTCGWTKTMTKPCLSKYQEYIDLSGDKDSWIGLLIWQHATGSGCKFDEGKKCVGCEESGTKREIQEGKKYNKSTLVFVHSIKKGWKHMIGNNNYPEYLPTSYVSSGTSNEDSKVDEINGGAPGGKFCIHNTAARDQRSIIWGYTPSSNPLSTILKNKDSGKKYNYEYRQMTN